MIIPTEFEKVAKVGHDLEGSYVCALNADNRTKVEQDFINWYRANVENPETQMEDDDSADN